jgi:hypothetical protein
MDASILGGNPKPGSTGLARQARERVTGPERQLAYSVGLWSAIAGVTMSILYIGCIASMIASGFTLPPPEPVATMIGALTMVWAVALVALSASIYFHTADEKKVLALTGLAFMIVFSVLTCLNRFVQLTVVREAVEAGRASEVQRFMPYEPGSIMLSLEMLAWGLFFSLAFLFIAPVFSGGRLDRGIRWSMTATGALSLLALVGYVLKLGALTVAGTTAWALGLPATTFLLLLFFWRACRHSVEW